METLNIYQKLLNVMSDVDYIQKDKKNTFHGYKYASEAAIKEKLHESLVRNRVLFLPRKTEIVERIAGLGKDQKEALTVINFHYAFVDVDTKETVEGSLHGIGADSMDKGIYKAITGAIKYALTGSFLIPTGDDPEDDSKDDKKQAKAEARSEQQAVAERKIAQIQAGTVPAEWDWRIALPRFEALEQKHGKTEVSIALKMAGYNSLEETPSREAALAAYEKVRTTLARAATEQPAWVEKPSAKPESKLEKAADPLQRMLERMDNFKGRLAVIQQHKFDLVQKYGQKEGEQRYYDVLDKHSGHTDTHANEIARHADKSRHVASELWLELHPEAVEEEVTA